VLLLLVLALAGVRRVDAAGDPAPLRFGFSARLFSDVNEDDARASLKVWAHTVGVEHGVPVDPMLEIYSDTDAIKEAMLGQKVDGVTMTTLEFWALRRAMSFRPSVVLGVSHGKTTEEYLLLVRGDNPATQLADLRGRSLAVASATPENLATIWGETLVLEAHLGTARTFWRKITRNGKISRVVLPVFFRQVDACIVTRDGFRTMSELNPQIGRQLRVLAQSPAVVTTAFCFRGDLVSPLYDKLVTNAGQVVDTPAGRQVMTLFHSEQAVTRPIAELDGACALLDRHQQLLAAAGPVASDPAPAESQPAGEKEKP